MKAIQPYFVLTCPCYCNIFSSIVHKLHNLVLVSISLGYQNDNGGGGEILQTLQLLYGSLIPFHHRPLDSIGLKKSENVWGSIMCILGGGGMSRNPNHDGTKSVLPILAVGDKTSCVDG